MRWKISNDPKILDYDWYENLPYKTNRESMLQPHWFENIPKESGLHEYLFDKWYFFTKISDILIGDKILIKLLLYFIVQSYLLVHWNDDEPPKYFKWDLEGWFEDRMWDIHPVFIFIIFIYFLIMPVVIASQIFVYTIDTYYYLHCSSELFILNFDIRSILNELIVDGLMSPNYWKWTIYWFNKISNLLESIYKIYYYIFYYIWN